MVALWTGEELGKEEGKKEMLKRSGYFLWRAGNFC
jgi:hypothetical protein